MIISDSHKFILFRPNKTGGSTSRSRLAKFGFSFPTKEIRCSAEMKKIYKELNIHHPEHIHFEAFKKTSFYNSRTKNQEPRKDYFKFVFARNPYDRVYSHMLQGLNRLREILDVKTLPPEKMFNPVEKWFFHPKNVLELCPNLIIQAQCYPIYKYSHYKGKNMMDFIGKVERFEEDFAKVCQILNLENVETKNANVRSDPKKCTHQEADSMPKHC